MRKSFIDLCANVYYLTTLWMLVTIEFFRFPLMYIHSFLDRRSICHSRRRVVLCWRRHCLCYFLTLASPLCTFFSFRTQHYTINIPASIWSNSAPPQSLELAACQQSQCGHQFLVIHLPCFSGEVRQHLFISECGILLFVTFWPSEQLWMALQ